MNRKKSNRDLNLFKQLFYSVFSNSLSLISGLLITFLVPKFLGVTSFGYYQLYIFYLTYFNLLTIGWPDGIYLRIGGKKISELNEISYKYQFYLYLILEIIFAVFISLYGYFFTFNNSRAIVFIFVSISGFFLCVRYFIIVLFQSTGKIKKFSKIIIVEKLLSFFLILILLLIGEKDFIFFLLADSLGKFCSLVMSFFISKIL